MHSNDFFRADAGTTLCEHFTAAGIACRLSTNSESLLEAARETFVAGSTQDPIEISIRLWVEDADSPRPPWPKPYVRGLGHLVFAGFDSRSSFLADLHTLRVIGRFSSAMAADKKYWRTIIFPVLLSIVCGSVGVIEIHASCVAKDGFGLILAGPSLSGKSTLALALTQQGFQLLSDDRIFCSFRRGELSAWGLSRPLKLRPEAAGWFDEFRAQEPNAIQNGERVFHHEVNGWRVMYCQPRMFVFLERRDEHGFSMAQLDRGASRSYIENELLCETSAARQRQGGTIEELLSLSPCLLRYGGTPKEIALQLADSFGSRQHC